MKKYACLLYACLFISLSSCLEITEQVRLHNNGSGQFTLTVDMNQAQPLIELANSLSDNEDGADAKTELHTGMDESYERLKTVKGIGQPVIIKSKDGLLSGITFEFSNVAALNKAINVMRKNEQPQQYFTYQQGQLHRLNTLDQQIKVEAASDNNLPNIDMTVNGSSIKDIMKSMVYRTEYVFDTPVKDVSNKEATLSADRRKVTVERYLLDDTHKAGTLENMIRF